MDSQRVIKKIRDITVVGIFHTSQDRFIASGRTYGFNFPYGCDVF